MSLKSEKTVFSFSFLFFLGQICRKKESVKAADTEDAARCEPASSNYLALPHCYTLALFFSAR